MRITEHMFAQLRNKLPDLFTPSEDQKNISTLFSEFLPNAALSNPDENPWGQYSNHETSPKRKTIVISFNNLIDAPFSELKKIDVVVSFLKRAGFTILIPANEKLEEYNTQLFDRNIIKNVGNKTRSEIQKLAMTRNISADKLYFIDEVKKELDEQYLDGLINQFKRIESGNLYRFNYRGSDKIAAEVGKLNIFDQWSYDESGTDEFEIPRVDSDVFNDDHSARELQEKFEGLTLSQKNALQDQGILDYLGMVKLTSTHISESEYENLNKLKLIFEFIEIPGNDIHDLIKLQSNELKKQIFDNLSKINELVKIGIPFNSLIKPEAFEIRKELLEYSYLANELIGARISFEMLMELKPEDFRNQVFKNAAQIGMIIGRDFTLADLAALESTLREQVINHAYSIYEYLKIPGNSINDLILLQPEEIRLLATRKAEGIAEMIKVGVSFEYLIRLEPMLREKIIHGSLNLSVLLALSKISIEDFINLAQRDFRDALLNENPEFILAVIELIEKGFSFSSLQLLESRDDLIKSYRKTRKFFESVNISNAELKELKDDFRYTVFMNAVNIMGQIHSSNATLQESLAFNEATLKSRFTEPTCSFMIELKKIREKNFGSKLILSNLYQLSIYKKLSAEECDFVKNNAGKIEHLFLKQEDRLEHYHGSFIFPELKQLDCHMEDFSNISSAPKITFLHINLSQPTLCDISDEKNENLTVNCIYFNMDSIPLINRLEIDLGLNEKQGEFLASNETSYSKNLIELSISGLLYPGLSFIDLLIKNSPNLRLLELHDSNFSEEKLNQYTEMFPSLTIHIHRFSGTEIKKSEMDEDAVYTNINSSTTLTSDFDTKHNPDKKFILTAACKHISKNKINSFRFTRDNIYTLDADALLQPTYAHNNMFYLFPIENEVTLTDVNHDFYEFTQEIDMPENTTLRLSSLSAHDVLFQLKLNGMPLRNSEIDTTRDDLGFYTITTRTRLKGQLNYIFDVPDSIRQQELIKHLPVQAQELFNTIRSFPSSGVAALEFTKKATPADMLKLMFEKKSASCRHRVAIFLLYFRELKKTSPASYAHIEVRIASKGGAHANIEISLDGGNQWSELDLGGYHIKFQYQNISERAKKPSSVEIEHKHNALLEKLKTLSARLETEKNPEEKKHMEDMLEKLSGELKTLPNAEMSATLPPIQFSSKKSKDMPQLDFQTVLSQIDKNTAQNVLLCVKKPSDIYCCLSHIRNLYKAGGKIQRPIFYIDSPEKMRTSLKRLKLNSDRTECTMLQPPAGLLHDFLILHKDSDPAPIIVINWDNFSFSEIISFNAAYDLINRFAGTTPIPTDATVVSIHSSNEKMKDLLLDASFVSRHTKGGVHDFSEKTLPPIPQIKNTIARSAPEKKLSINLHQSPRWHDILIGYSYVDGDKSKWHDGELLALLIDHDITSIAFINPPIADLAFENLLADLRSGQPLLLLNQRIPIRPVEISVVTEPEFTLNVSIDLSYTENIIPASYVINASTFEQCLHSKIINADGLSFRQKGLLEKNMNGTLALCITGALSDSQWSLLLDSAKKYKVRLEVALTQGVTLPARFPYIISHKTFSATTASPARFIITDNIEYTVSIIENQFKNSIKVIDISEISVDDLFCKIDFIVSSDHFLFAKKFTDIWLALQAGETVILKGNITNDLFNYFSSLLAPTPYFMLEGQKIALPGKLIFITDKTFKPPAWLHTEKESTPIESKKRICIRTLMLRKLDPDDLSLEACNLFEANRLNRTLHVLQHSPYAVLEGPPGAGKSYFIRVLKNQPRVKIYRENEIEKWATEKFDGLKILFRDEINMRNTDCSQDRDLMNMTRSFFHNARYFKPDENCRILYAQNPNDFAGERREPKLFQDHPEIKIHFGTMHKAFLLHRILKPIFETTFIPPEFSECEAENRAKIILKNHSAVRSMRDLQNQAIIECALHRDPIPPKPLAATKEICFGENNFIITASRSEPYRNLLTLLRVRKFKRALCKDNRFNNSRFDGAKYNGLNGAALQGPSGIGKSEFFEKILPDEKYIDATPNQNHSQAQIDAIIEAKKTGEFFYKLPVEIDIVEKIRLLDQAFHEGAMIIINEIDTCKLIEAYLNTYLTGEDMDRERPKKLGFAILCTFNGGAMKGREILPTPLLSRMLPLKLDEYHCDELIQILKAKLIMPSDNNNDLATILKENMINYLVSEFLLEQSISREVAPTFRDLYDIAKTYFNDFFDRYVQCNLSMDQHKFMLVYRCHPQHANLLFQFEHNTLDPKKMGLLEMNNALRKSNVSASLFNPRLASEAADSCVKQDDRAPKFDM
ncbi:MAG: hypothetical protein NTZ67_02650 [Gammaproteobacteria bacterium]|nr:hypothetical protein [Gammaproteobacteria bacterium]